MLILVVLKYTTLYILDKQNKKEIKSATNKWRFITIFCLNQHILLKPHPCKTHGADSQRNTQVCVCVTKHRSITTTNYIKMKGNDAMWWNRGRRSVIIILFNTHITYTLWIFILVLLNLYEPHALVYINFNKRVCWIVYIKKC